MIDPATAQAAGPPQQPTTAAALLRLLGVSDACALRQRTVLAEWLEHNTAGPELKLSIRANGYGIILPPVRHCLPLSPVVAKAS